MPADRTAPRLGSDAMPSDTASSRRARSEISCAECRRMKIRCDRKVPCTSCTKRGISRLCPNETLSKGIAASKFIVEDTQTLYGKLNEMSSRIKDLEEALSSLQSRFSNETHPLLRSELLTIKQSTSPAQPNVSDDIETNGADQLTGAMGTLYVSEKGDVEKFVGGLGGFESYYTPGDDDSASEGSFDPVDMSYSTPTTLASQSIPRDIWKKLPEWTRARQLAEIYLNTFSWFSAIVDRRQLINELLPSIYDSGAIRPNPSICKEELQANLALLLIIFGIAGTLDMSQSPYSEANEELGQLSFDSLMSLRVLENSSLQSTQALTLGAQFCALKCTKVPDMEKGWLLAAFGSKVALIIGLHRDVSKWNTGRCEQERRQRVFSEMYWTELVFAIASGRPPSCLPGYFDSPAASYGSPWRYRFAHDVFAPVVARTFEVKEPSYKVVIELDRKVKDFSEQVIPNTAPPADASVEDSYDWLQQRLIPDAVLMHLHRAYFARAITARPDDPMQSAYAPSFLTMFDKATGTLSSLRLVFERSPDFAARVCQLWSCAFTAMMVLGCIAVKCPKSNLAATAAHHFCLGHELFEKAAPQGRRPSRAMPALDHIKAKVAQSFGGNATAPNSCDPNTKHGQFVLAQDPLQLFVGSSVVQNPSSSSSSSSGTRQSDSASPQSFSDDSFGPLYPVSQNIDLFAQPMRFDPSALPLNAQDAPQPDNFSAAWPAVGGFNGWADLVSRNSGNMESWGDFLSLNDDPHVVASHFKLGTGNLKYDAANTF